ncbi:MAG: ABC transporter permease, partial [Bryobacteraceae bacterium]
MAKLREWVWRLLHTFRAGRLDREMETELRFHLDMEAEAARRRGLPPEEAARAARLRAGDVTGALEEVRDQRGLGWLDGSLADLRQAWVALGRHRGFTAIAATALAFAVAINTLVFAVGFGVILKPLPYPEPDRLVRLYESSQRRPKFPLSMGVYSEYKRESRTLAGVALYTRVDLQLMHGEQPERLPAVRVSHDFFPLLGVAPMLGRNFEESEMVGSPRVVILSHRLWASRFQGDREIVGKTVRLNRESWTIVGVMPPGFQHVGGSFRSPLQGDTVAVWWPLNLDLKEPGRWAFHFTNAVGRLKPGVTIAQAEEDLGHIAEDVKKRYGQWTGNFRATATPLAGEVTGGSRVTVSLLVIAGLLVLLVACANVAGLCIARGLARRKETAIRATLGGGAWRLVRGILAENLVLGIIGGAAGLLLAGALFPLLDSILPLDFPRRHEIRFTALSAGFALLTALATSLIAGILPALRQTRVDPREGLSDESRFGSLSREAARLRSSLVAVEAGFACVLCVCAALLLRSAILLDARDHGFSQDGVLTFQLSLPRTAYAKSDHIERFHREMATRWSALPGVRSVGIGTSLPWTGYDDNTSFTIVGRSTDRTQPMPFGRYQAAGPGYFEALRTPLISGRYFDASDAKDKPPVLVINESLARRYFPNEQPLGQSIDIFGAKRRIVGVVADVRDRPADLGAEPANWMSMAQQPFDSVMV